jgi:hypothetical protein
MRYGWAAQPRVVDDVRVGQRLVEVAVSDPQPGQQQAQQSPVKVGARWVSRWPARRW